MRPAILVWLLLIAAASAFVFVTGRQVDALEAELERVNRRIVAESEAIRVLRTEWSYLNRPDRLRHLARELTALEPAGVGHIAASAAAVPYPLPERGDIVTLAATRIPGFSQLPMPDRHPNAGPPPLAAEPAGAAIGPAQPAPRPAGPQPARTADRDPIGALLASLDVPGAAAAGPGGGARP